MTRNLQLLKIPDLIWIDYICLILWSQINNNNSTIQINLLKDFPVIRLEQVRLGILFELYWLWVIQEFHINQNLKRIYTFADEQRNNIQEDIVKSKRNFSDWYWLNIDLSSQYDITIVPDKWLLSRFLNKRLKKWEEEKSYENTSNPKSVLKQKEDVWNYIIKMIRWDGLMGKNMKVPCLGFLHDTDMWENQNLLVSDLNPFLVLYSFEKEKLVDISWGDFNIIRVSLNADICINDKKKLYDEEVMYKYGFTIPINKKKAGIFFDTESWNVFVKGKNYWRIKFGTRQFSLFEFLYKNQWKVESNSKIVEILWWKYSEKDKAVNDIKRDLPEKIKLLIKSSKGGYRLIDDIELNP